jgi:hypothetical protein
MGLIGPTTSPEFLQHFTDYTIPQIANAASLSGFTTTEELQGFFETEFDPGKSTLGLLPGDVDSSAFVQQYGPTPPSISGFASPEGVEGPPSAPLRLRPEQPIPESAFLPFMREAAGDDPLFFQYMIGQTPELVEGFGTAKDELRHRLSLANLQQQTAFAQTPSRLGPLEERLARHHTAAEGIEFIEGLPGSSTSPGFDTAVQQGFLSSKELKALQAGIERERGSVRENLPALAAQQAGSVQRQVEGFTPQQFFEQRREGLVSGFALTPTGLASEIRQRGERPTAEDAEAERRLKLRGRGRTVMRV